MTSYTAWSNTNEMGGSSDAYAYDVDGMSMVRTKSQQNSYYSASKVLTQGKRTATQNHMGLASVLPIWLQL